MTTQQPLTIINLKQHAQSGCVADVDYLMQNLHPAQTFTHCKMIDFALSLVTSDEGRQRIKHFLFNGSHMQRNYAALYFKRRGANRIIDEAVQHGHIDKVQAYLK